MRDLTFSNVQDLTDIVFKDDYLYSIRHHLTLEAILRDLYKFTEEQLNHLNQALEEDYLT